MRFHIQERNLTTMKKKYIYILFILAASFISLIPYAGHRNSGQAPLGRTGAPGESTCGACHGGGDYTGSMTFDLGEITSGQYQPGETYTISFTADYDAPRYGFSVTALDADDQPAGDFALVNEDNTSYGVSGNDRQYVGHKNADATSNWSFEWTAPGDASGDVTFYYVVNAANADNGTGGDMIETGSVSFSAAADDEDLYTLTLLTEPENAGTVEGGGDYEEGETVSISAEAHEGYGFVSWLDDQGGHVSDEPDFEYTMPSEDITLIAHFVGDTYTLSFDIRDANDTPIEDAIITLDEETFDPGVYVFDDLSPGDYMYAVAREGYEGEEGTATITDVDKTITVTLSEEDTSISDLMLSETEIYPNPATAFLNLDFAGMQVVEVTIVDMMGKRFYHTRVQDFTHAIDVSRMPTGLYYLQLKTAGEIHTKPVQISR